MVMLIRCVSPVDPGICRTCVPGSMAMKDNRAVPSSSNSSESIAIGRIAKLLRPGGHLYYRDNTFSFDPADYEAAIARWMVESPKRCGYSKAEMFGHLRDEYTTYAWIMEGLFERAGFEVVSRELTPDSMQAEYLCRVRG